MSNQLDTPVEEKLKVDPPPKYNVVMLNDDKTTFEFVQAMLITYFGKTIEQSKIIANEIHLKGEAIVGKNYDLDTAETKVKKISIEAQAHKFPLTCKIQEQV